jgi:hypothetical protein
VPKGLPNTVTPPVVGSTVARRASGLGVKPESVTVKKTPSRRAASANAPLTLKEPTLRAAPVMGSIATSTLP